MEEMLVKFDYFYGGHIGFSDIAFDATPVDDRVVTNQKLASVFETIVLAEVIEVVVLTVRLW